MLLCLEKYRFRNVFIAITPQLGENEELFQKPEYKNVKNLKPRKVGTNEDEDVFQCGI